MKATRHIPLKVFAMMAIAIAFALPSRAQTSDTFYSNIDWQFNFPILIGLEIF